MNPLNPSDSAPGVPQTPGAMLRAAREARGVHLGMLSVTLKVPTRQLEALENDQYDAFRGPAFVRAVAQSVCRHLGIDPAPVLAGLPQTAKSMAMGPAGIEAPARPALPGGRSPRASASSSSRQVVLLAGLMLAGVAALIWWPAPSPQPQAGAPGVVEPSQSPSSGAMVSEPPVPLIVPSVPASSMPAAAPPPASTPAAPAMAPAAAVSPVATAPAPAASAASVQVAASAARKTDMQIQATGDTWLEVRDARGQLVVNRLLKAGEVQVVDLPAPYSVVVGRAHEVKVTQAGKPFDLTPHTKVSTARFEVQP